MMEPEIFLKTIYLGDRYCKKIVLDGIADTFELHVDSISRVRDASGLWNYYRDEDIDNGVIVVAGVWRVLLDSSGFIPNADIYDIKLICLEENSYQFIFEMGYVDKNAEWHDVVIKVSGSSIYLVDPRNPDVKITT